MRSRNRSLVSKHEYNKQIFTSGNNVHTRGMQIQSLFLTSLVGKPFRPGSREPFSAGLTDLLLPLVYFGNLHVHI